MPSALEEVRRVLTPLEQSVLSYASNVGWDVEDVWKEMRLHARTMTLGDEVGSGERLQVSTSHAIGPSREEIRTAIDSIRRKLSAAAEARARRPAPEPRRRNGKTASPVVASRGTVTRQDPEEESMSASNPPPQEGFAERYAREQRELAERFHSEAREEALAIVEDLRRLRFRSHQVRNVFRQLGRPLPPQILRHAHALDIAEDADPEPAGEAPVEPATAPEEQEAPPTPDEPVAGPEEPAEASQEEPETRTAQEKLAQRSSTERDGNRAKVRAAVEKLGGAGLQAIVEEVGDLRQPAVSKHLKSLIEDGEIRREGTPGTKTVRYLPSVPPSQAGRPSADTGGAPVAPASSVEPTGAELNLLTRVRDWAVGHKDGAPFSVAQGAATLDLPNHTVRVILVELAKQGIIVDDSVPGAEAIFHYEKPTEPGKAAELDQQRRRESTSNGTGSEPVAGTGGGIRASNREVQAILDQCIAQVGADKVSRTGSDHFVVKTPDGGRVILAGTPSHRRSLMEDKARLRRAGLKIS